MPTEEQIKRWSDAYDGHKAPADELKNCESLDPSDGVYKVALAHHRVALVRYNAAPEELG